MDNQELIDAGAAGGTIAMALLDALITKGLLSKADATTILDHAQGRLAYAYKSEGAGAAAIVGAARRAIVKTA